MSKRTYGTGQLYTRTSSAGVESWYGKWRVDGRRVNRALGEKRSARAPDGLTAKQAEAALRDAMGSLTGEELERLKQDKLKGGKTVLEVLEAYLLARDLKESTATDYAMHVRVHLGPFFAGKTVGDIKASDVERLIAHLSGLKLKTKTVRTYVTTLSTLFNYAVRKGWLKASPMLSVDLPPLRDHDFVEPLRFLRVHEVNDLIAAVQDGPYRRLGRALYTVAALTDSGRASSAGGARSTGLPSGFTCDGISCVARRRPRSRVRRGRCRWPRRSPQSSRPCIGSPHSPQTTRPSSPTRGPASPSRGTA